MDSLVGSIAPDTLGGEDEGVVDQPHLIWRAFLSPCSSRALRIGVDSEEGNDRLSFSSNLFCWSV
jgi:hypothetical protein